MTINILISTVIIVLYETIVTVNPVSIYIYTHTHTHSIHYTPTKYRCTDPFSQTHPICSQLCLPLVTNKDTDREVTEPIHHKDHIFAFVTFNTTALVPLLLFLSCGWPSDGRF